MSAPRPLLAVYHDNQGSKLKEVLLSKESDLAKYFEWGWLRGTPPLCSSTLSHAPCFDNRIFILFELTARETTPGDLISHSPRVIDVTSMTRM